MRKTFILACGVALMGMATVACADSVKAAKDTVASADGNGKNVKQTRDVSASVTSVSVASVVDVHYTQGTTASIRVKAPANIIDKVMTEVKGSQLKVWLDGNFYLKNDDDIDVYLTLPNLKKVDVVGSADFEAEGKVKASALTLTVAGSGDIYMKSVECDQLTATVAGSGDIDIDRLKARQTKWSVAGSGDVEAALQGVETITALVAGSGDLKLKCDACGHASVSVAGSGDAKLTGTVASLKKSAAGMGDINTSGLTITGGK